MIINKLVPVELHLPGYNFCGPFTRIKERVARGDKGINPLDEAWKEHDLRYYEHKDLRNRIAIDRRLAWKAYNRIYAEDATRGERLVAGVITSAFCTKLHVTTRVSRT